MHFSKDFLSAFGASKRLNVLAPAPAMHCRRPARQFACARALLGCLVLASQALAADLGRAFDVPAGDAVDTLKLAARQADLEIIFFAEAVQGIRTVALRGMYRPREALELLVAGTPLDIVGDEGSGTVTIRRKAAEPEAGQNPAVTSPPNKRMKLKNPLVALGTWLALAISSGHAADAGATGTVAGTVTDAGSNGYAMSAVVRIEGTTLQTITDRQGEFVLNHVPAGTHSLVIDYVGTPLKRETVTVAAGQRSSVDIVLPRGDVIMLQEMRIESARLGQSRAINQQRASNTISNIISSDAIGNLPDRTVGEALGRLPGVNVVDDSYASIRGISAEHNAVTLDGDRMTPSTDIYSTSVQYDTRAVDLSLIPAEMVGGIEVIKALTADKDADSFGGTINLVTRSAFDLKERSINGKLEYIYNDYHNRPGRAGSITYMDVLNSERTLGISATLTYRTEERNSDSYEFGYHDADEIPVGTSGSGTAGSIAAVGDEAMEAYDVRHNYQDVTKLGGTLNLSWKASEATELHFRSFYENTDQDAGRFRLRARALSRWDPASTATLQKGSQVRLVNLHEDGFREQEVLRLGVEGKTRLQSGLLEYGLRYGDSSQIASRDRYIFEFRSNTERRRYSWTMDRTNPVLPILGITHIATGENGLFHDLADRGLSSIRLHYGTDDETDLTGNLDYSFNQLLGRRSIDWKVGAKYRTKDRSLRPGIEDYTPPSSAVPNFAQFSAIHEPRDMLDGSLATMGPFVSLPEVMASFRANQSAYTAASGDELVRLEARKYDVSEDVMSGYAMASTTFVEKLEAIAGLRWESTKTGYYWLADPAGASRGDRSYNDVYPSVILNYRFRPNFIARFAWTNTLSRPSYGDLIPYRVLADTQSESGTGGVEPDDFPETNKVFLGNSNLKAQQSRNFDLSLEYYNEPAGLFSVALFRKDLSDVIFRSQWKEADDPTTIYFQERNGSSGKVDGIEVSWQQALTFLPGPLDGLGVNLNATFIKGSSVLEELVPGTTNTYRPLNVDFLPEQPETVYNAQVWWEKYGITARVAVNYVDEFVRTSGGLTSFSVNDKATRWDASLSYRLTKNFIVFIEGRNLTEEVSSWYATTPSHPEDYTFTGRTFSGGIKFRF